MKNRLAIIQLFIANTISGIAQGISMIAIPWYFAKNEEMGKFGILYWIATLASVFWVPICGMLVDKYDRKKLFLVVNSICGLLILGTAGLGYWNGFLPWYWTGFVFVITFFNYNLHFPALYAFAQEITEPQYYGRITSLLEIVQQSTSILAGAGAALLLEGSKNGIINLFGFSVQLGWDLEAWEIYEIFAIDGLTYILSFLVIWFIQYSSLTERKPETGTIIERIKIGVDWLKNHINILIFGIGSHSVFAIVMVINFFVNATYVQQHLEAGGAVFATSEMFFAMGAVFSGIAIRRIFQSFSIPKSIVWMTLLVACLMFILFATNSISIFYGSLFLLGLCNAGVRIQRVTFIFKNIPNQVIGRTGSVFRIVNVLIRAFFIGIFSFAFFQFEGVIWGYLIMSVFLVLSTVVLMWNSTRI
ncbi:MAG: MFS transporter [Saprospiraceae bacterium]|jgi:MFS family permease|nr:MFS transporter [Saprospiraceae bacterium]